jgi:hypothetical protein
LGVAALRNGKIDIAAPHLQRAVDMRRGYVPIAWHSDRRCCTRADPRQR